MTTEDEQIRRDSILGATFIASSLLAFGLSFTLAAENGRPILFFATLAVSLFCLWKAKYRAALAVAFGAVLLLRILWGFLVY